MRTINDQYTAGLRNSTELRNALGIFGRAMQGKSDPAERFAVSLQLQSDLRKHDPSGYAAALDAVDKLRSSPDYVNLLAVGERTCCPPGPNTSPMCTLDGRRICDYDRVGDRDIGVAGNGIFTLTPQPAAGFSQWRPKMVRMFAHDVTNPSIPRWEGLFITTITIGQHPVEGFSVAPAAGAVAGIHFGDFVVPDNSGVPVGWPDFTNEALSNQLTISGIGMWSADIDFTAYVTVMGNPIKNNAECRVNGDSSPLPPTPYGGTAIAGGNRF